MASVCKSFGRVVQGALRFNIASSRVVMSSQTRGFHLSPFRHDVGSDFVTAQEQLSALKADPGNQAKLKLYALYKQAETGKVNTSRPGMTNFVGRAKWDAWNSLGDMTKEEAMLEYISTVNELFGASVTVGATSASDSDLSSDSGSGDVVLTRDGRISIIKLNRPDKKNAIKIEMYDEIADLLEKIAKDDSSLAVITGAGDYYCSGNDLSNFMQVDPSNIAEFAVKGSHVLKRFVGAFIDFPKPLVAVINGPAVGVSVTTLGLCDAVFATEKATFNTPFSALGQTPEGCSSYVFPKLMGHSKAAELLMFNRMLTATEACARGLVTQVFPVPSFQEEVWAKVREMADNPPQTMRYSKGLIRDAERETLHRVNNAECERLVERWQSEECMNAIINFFQKKSKM